MANIDNSCSGLLIEDSHLQLNTNSLEALMSLQKKIQEEIYQYNFQELQQGPLTELRQFFDWNYHAIQDELREVFDALGGIKDGVAGLLWQDQLPSKLKTMTICQLTKNDQQELKMELIDCLHFLFNMMIAVKLESNDVVKKYLLQDGVNLKLSAATLSSNDLLRYLVDYQTKAQEELAGYRSYFKLLGQGPILELKKFFDWNYHVIQDGLRNVFQALGGANQGIGNGVWKPWKSSHQQAQVMTLNTMTPQDLELLQVELVNCLRPLLNMMIAVNMSSNEIVNYYFAKNKENISRQQRGY